MKSSGYQINLPDHPTVTVFVNGLKARTWKGWLWILSQVIRIGQETKSAPGCLHVKGGFCSHRELILVSYWHDEKSLMQFFRGAFHRKLVDFVTQNPDALCLYNEIYHPSRSGKYLNEPQGLATIYPAMSG